MQVLGNQAAGGGIQGAEKEICQVIKIIQGSVQFATGFHKVCLVFKPSLTENTYGFLCRYFFPDDGEIAFNDLLHFIPELAYLIRVEDNVLDYNAAKYTVRNKIFCP